MARRSPRSPGRPAGDSERDRIEANRLAAHAAFDQLREPLGYGFRRSAGSATSAEVVLRPLLAEFSLQTRPGNAFEAVSGYGAVDPAGRTLYLNPAVTGRLDGPAWTYVIGHLLLHLGLEHHRRGGDVALRAADESVVHHLALSLALGTPPAEFAPISLPEAASEALAERLRAGDLGPVPTVGLAGPGRDDVVVADVAGFPARLGEGLDSLLDLRIEALDPDIRPGRRDLGEQARRYLMANHPLVAGMVSRIRLVSDKATVSRAGVTAAAVFPELGEVLLALDSTTTLREAVFLLAHEIFHLGLDHAARRGSRDTYIWNLACDFKINAYLVAMAIGTMPPLGVLYDPALAKHSAEEIYDILADDDPKRLRNLRTFAGLGKGDMLTSAPRPILRGDVAGLEETWLSLMRFGLDACALDRRGPGLVPAELEEEIHALSVAPIAWDVALAHWFERHVPLAQPVRTYGRASRRQAATPDIPRPRRYFPERLTPLQTFGVVLDTSGSMDRVQLAKALGAIAAYAEARDVSELRLVHCDAAPYDDGYVSPTALTMGYTVKGRGGTVLGAAVAHLLAAPDFPDKAPILLVTDGYIEEELAAIGRPHAWLVVGNGPAHVGRTGGEVFRVS